jgi:putative peptide zinc metalloprotease protein
LIVATKLFFVGVALALASLGQMLVVPMMRGLFFLLRARELRGRRLRAWLGAGSLTLVLVTGLFVVKMPHALVADGVVWVPAEAIIRAEADGFVADIATRPGTEVAAGAPLFRLTDPVAMAQADVLRAEAAVQASRYNAAQQLDRVQARLIGNQLARAEAAFQRAQQRLADLDIVATRPGRFVVPRAATLVGRFVHQGDVLGYVLGGDDIGVRAVVAQADLDLARAHTTRVDVLLSEQADRPLSAQVTGQTPSALERPPAPALAAEGGGPMLTDPGSPGHDRPLDRWYEFELALAPADAGAVSRIGEHASVRFDLGAEPIAWRWLLWARQAVLRTLNI